MSSRFEDNSGAAKDRLDRSRVKAAYAVGLFVQAEASKRCKVDTGRLRASITFATSEDVGLNAASRGRDPADASTVSGYRAKPGEVVIGTPVEYAAPVELGTAKRPAFPFLRPAAVENEGTIKQIISDILAEGMGGDE